MRRTSRRIALALVLLAGGIACARVLGGDAPPESSAGWIVDPADNVCGLSDPRMLSRPAVLRYADVLAATPEARRMEREGIDPNSPRGQILRQQAADRVFHASEFVRARDGFCSVWKRIQHRDGRVIPDVSDAVRGRFPPPEPAPENAPPISAR